VSRTTSAEPIRVVDYDPAWPELFEALAARALAALGDVALRADHVGSTAVPGLAAKPIVDLDVVVAGPGDVRTAVGRLATIGYVHRGDLGIPGREAFRPPDGDPPHHLYVVVDGNLAHRRHLALRDHLRADPDAAERYATLKRRLADRHRYDVDAYTEAKDEFIVPVLAVADPETLNRV